MNIFKTMKYLNSNAAAPQGGNAAHQGRTGVESVNESTGYGEALLYGGLGILLGVTVSKVVNIIFPSKPTKKKRRKVVDDEVEVPTQEADVKVNVAVPAQMPTSTHSHLCNSATETEADSEITVEDRIRQLRAEGKNYPTIAHELHVSILVISRVLKAGES